MVHIRNLNHPASKGGKIIYNVIGYHYTEVEMLLATEYIRLYKRI
jgi:hypothetical protein